MVPVILLDVACFCMVSYQIMVLGKCGESTQNSVPELVTPQHHLARLTVFSKYHGNIYLCGPHVFCVATGYGLDSLGIESR